MSIRTLHEAHNCWFITFTCYDWKPLFELTAAYDLAYKWFKYLTDSKKAQVLGYVIMPNHLHVILYLPDDTVNLNKLIANGKRFLAYDIIKRLKAANHNTVLAELGNAVMTTDKSKGQKHRVFEPSFDAKPIHTEEFFWQKLQYIHLNPVKGKWNLAEHYTDYEHSSAAFYEMGTFKFFKPTDYRTVGS